MSSTTDVLSWIETTVRKDFESNRRVLAFDEYLGLISERPEQQLRGSAQFALSMLDHFGKSRVEGDGDLYRFHLFDLPVDGIAPKVVGHERVQTQIYKALQSFVQQGMNNKLLLLHGPNGSAKSTIIHAIMEGMERYSHELGGALYSFGWVFPHERITKGSIGIQNNRSSEYSSLESYAKLPDEDVATRLMSDLRDHPLLLVPSGQRRALLEKLLGPAKAEQMWNRLPHYLKLGDLSHQNRMIFDALLTSYNGDYRKVLRHVQVDRLYYSRRYRRGLITIEPQLHVDAQYNLLTYNRNFGALPSALQNLNFFALSGDLVEGNRGMIEYSDLLKRPLDSFKYLLIACETGAVNVGSAITYLDTLLVGSSNELQLDAFKEFPDFSSFKARIELIRVPYLLTAHQEEEIYQAQIQQFSGGKFTAPHVAWTVALWAVLTRLKKPNSLHYPPQISTLIGNMTPIEKARLYDTGEMPEGLTAEERKVLRTHISKLREEYANIPYYEGRMGASAREIKTILFEAAQLPEFQTLSPLAVMRAMEDFVKRISEYEFLKQDVKDGYHDTREFINTVRNEYLGKIDHEVRDAIGLYDSGQWEEFMRRYVLHLSHLLKKEKIHNTVTGKPENPDTALIGEFEKIVGAPQEEKELAAFRQNVLTTLGAWSLDHPGKPVVYGKVFQEFWKKLEKHFFESQKAQLTQMHTALQVFGTEQFDTQSEGGQLARRTIDTMKSRYGYDEPSAREVIMFLMKSRY